MQPMTAHVHTHPGEIEACRAATHLALQLEDRDSSLTLSRQTVRRAQSRGTCPKDDDVRKCTAHAVAARSTRYGKDIMDKLLLPRALLSQNHSHHELLTS